MNFKKAKPLVKNRRPETAVPPPSTEGLPAYCTSCEFLFLSPEILTILPRAKNVRFINGKTRCPKCRGQAHILDGTFDIVDRAVTLLSGPKFTKDALTALANLIERAGRDEITPEELEQGAGEIDKDLGTLVADAVRDNKFAALLVLILFLRSCHFNLEMKLDFNQLWDQIVAGANHAKIQPASVEAPKLAIGPAKPKSESAGRGK